MFPRYNILMLPLSWGKTLTSCVAVFWLILESFIGIKSFPWWLRGILLYILYELIFYLVEWIRFSRINSSINTMPDPSRMKEAMDRFKTLKNILDIDEFLEGWFCGSKRDAILKGNMVEFIAYGFYSRRPEDLSQDELHEIESFLVNTAKCWNISFQEGYDPTVKFMGHTLEPIKAFHKPLALYLSMELFAIIAQLMLRIWKFQRICSGKTIKWVKKPSHTRQDPVIFLHGVGFGVLPYLHFIHAILQGCKRPLIIVEMPHVALRICREAPELTEIAQEIVSIVQEFGDKCTLIGHSYGTFVIAKMLHQYPKVVRNVVMLDPVSLMTCHPRLLSNFVYRSVDGFPSSSKHLMEFAQFVCSRDLTLSQTFCRKFNGMEIQLWPDEIPPNSLIVLSGRDRLVPADLIRKQLKSECSERDVRILYHEKHAHGGFLFDLEWMACVVHEVLGILQQQTSLSST